MTETRTYVGDSGNHVFDGYADVRRGRQYQLTFERRIDGTAVIVLGYHEHMSAGMGPLVVKEGEVER